MYERGGIRRTRHRLRGVLVALAGILPACAAPAADAPLVDLDASALRPGPLPSWPNGGSLAGSFEVRSSEGPVVATVAGRAAVKLSEKMWLRSTFPAPASIARGRPFTLAVWAHPAKLVGKMVIASWAPRPHDCAEFGYGKGREGAFCGWRRDVAYRRPRRAGGRRGRRRRPAPPRPGGPSSGRFACGSPGDAPPASAV